MFRGRRGQKTGILGYKNGASSPLLMQSVFKRTVSTLLRAHLLTALALVRGRGCRSTKGRWRNLEGGCDAASVSQTGALAMSGGVRGLRIMRGRASGVGSAHRQVPLTTTLCVQVGHLRTCLNSRSCQPHIFPSSTTHPGFESLTQSPEPPNTAAKRQPPLHHRCWKP